MVGLLIVSGASSGLGAGLCRQAAKDGWALASISRSAGPGQHLALDLSQRLAWSKFNEWLVDLIDAHPDQPVTFVHSAAMIDPLGFVVDAELEDYGRALSLNAAAAQVMAGAVIAALNAKDRPGLVLMVSSAAARLPRAGLALYSCAKRGIDVWTKTVGLEQDQRIAQGSFQHPVRVVSIAPGSFETKMQRQLRSSKVEDLPASDRFRQLYADGELGSVDSVAEKLWKLCNNPALTQATVGFITDWDD